MNQKKQMVSTKTKSDIKSKELKLDTKRTIYVGFAFFTILMLMQVYNNYCSVFLEELGVNPLWTGVMMALDNVFALFMLPFFGNLSDKSHSKVGKRTIFIIIGVLMASLSTPLIIIAFLLKSKFYLIVSMGLVLIAINMYRSPAVALMPDVTPKPLRSKANAIINLVGYAGGIVATVLYTVTGGVSVNSETHELLNANKIWIPFVVLPVICIIVLVIFLIKVKENKLLKDVKEEMEIGEAQAETIEKLSENKPLGKHNKFNLIIILLSVCLWKFGFNAVETFGSNFVHNLTPENDGWWGTVSLAMIAVSIISFIPAGKITEKLGRKKTVILGNFLMILGLMGATYLTITYTESISHMLFIIPIIPIGMGWAWINVNSYTMVVELSTKQNVGKYTGYYYLFSNVAEILTPIVFGAIASVVESKYKCLFLYSLVVIDIAIMVFSLYKNKRWNQAKIIM